MFAEVIVDISADAIDRTFQYKIPDELKNKIHVGSPVSIPFGRGDRMICGYVVEITDTPSWPVEKIKSIASIQDKDIPVEGQLLALAAWIRERYGTTMNEALKTVLPIKKKVKSVEEHWLTFAVNEDKVKKELDRCLLRHYRAKARLLQGMINEGGRMSTRLATKKYNINRSVIDGFVKDGIIEVKDEKIYRNPMTLSNEVKKKVSLNEEQQRAVSIFTSDYKNGVRKTYLLYGVTGSGKTEVYMEMMADVIKEGKQVIMLIPEIALTYQTVYRFQARFGDRISIMNSRMSDGERYDQYERARRGDVDIVVGPRSALFAPFDRLGLIIMDEEHEMGYKSESPPKYHARDVARARASMTGASLVLGSATPSVESYYAAQMGAYTLLTLKNRAKDAAMPLVHVVDLRQELKEGNRSVFSRLLQDKIKQRLDRHEQVILFLNRRGYAGFVSCRSCGFVLKCSHCEVSMTAHKNHVGDLDTLVCHYCGHAIAMPRTCPECGSPYIASFGLGTQRVEEMLHKLFPQARVLRMDSDTTSGKHGHENILTPFRNGKADILIGTQMIVKGHDFPNVTLVSALAADMSMYSGDYRSSERTFDLLMQAAGRAGRGDKKGEMIIQTYNPDQYCIQAIQSQKAEDFYDHELLFRRTVGYPPYTVMSAVLVLSEQESSASACIEELAAEIARCCKDKVTLIGPTKAGLSRAKDRYRYVLHIKCKDESVMDIVRSQTERIAHKKQWERTCSVQYDRDPMMSY